MNAIPSLLLLLALSGDDGKGPESAYEHPSETDAQRAPSLDASGGALIRGVTVHDAVREAYVADVLVTDGKIAAIGDDLDAPEGALVVDGDGMHLAPGVIDTHSHMAIERGVNEGTLSITAECDITDVINTDDLGLYRALAGGVTTIQCLHGSANAIGGRSEVLKLRWRRPVEELRFEGAPQGIKFALGENPKRSNWGSGNRYPATRPGVESVFERGFRRAQEYAAEWGAYEEALARGEDPAPPRRDVRLDVLVGILDGEVKVHSHCYRADEILMLLRTAERFGFRIQTLQHVLEGYKVAAEIAAHGAGGSTFSDWWSYKQEAYDAIPQNAALMDEAGVVASVNSDSGELVRHLYHEAAKSVRYADLHPVRALALVTRNPAIQLGIEDRVGTIEVGKDADLVLLDDDPLSIYSRVEWTMVDGEIQFERRDAFGLDEEQGPVRELASGAAPIEAARTEAAGSITAIVGGTLHPVEGPSVEGTLLIQGSRILALGPDVEVPADASVVDASGKHLWPGIIALSTSLGLAEIGSVRGTQDTREIGGNHPDVRVASSIHAASAHIPVVRSNGITRAQAVPTGGPLAGQSAVVRTTGSTWEEMLAVDRDMLHLYYPRMGGRRWGGGPDREKEAKKPEEPEAIAEVRELLEDAREHRRLIEEAEEFGVAPPPFDSRLEALAPYALGERPVAIHASSAQELLFAIKLAQEEELDAILFGATEGWKVAPAIAASGYPVVVGPVQTVPRSQYDPFDAGYANPALLHRAGVKVAIMNNGSDGTLRNVPFQAGFAAAWGLPYEEALRSITLYPAEILGIDDDLGSLAPGKLADVVVTDGDLLEATAKVTAVFIEGEPQDVANRQTRLYDTYHERLHAVQGK